jgi:hypothetical protein
MIYITGYTHRDFSRLIYLNDKKDGTLIVLGEVDENINYYKWYCGHYHAEK